MQFFDVSSCLYLRPGCPDSILDFGRLLLPERDHLAQVFRAFTSCQDFDFNVIDLHFFFRVRAKAALVAENFRLFSVDPDTHFFSTFLEVAQHFLKLFFGGGKQEHVVSKSHVCEAVVVVVAHVDSHSFLSFASDG